MSACHCGAGDRDGPRRAVGRAVDEVDEGGREGEVWQRECGEGLSLEGLLGRLFLDPTYKYPGTLVHYVAFPSVRIEGKRIGKCDFFDTIRNCVLAERTPLLKHMIE